MANRILSQIYMSLYGEEFSYSEFSKRLKMQKGIYLLQEMGVPVGDYRFSWYKHGPYSQALLDDMHIASSTTSVTLPVDAKISIDELRDALTIPDSSKYTVEDWAECLGSLHYLKENIFSFGAKDDQLLNELTKRKPHLNDNEANKIALSRIESLFS